MTFAEYLHRVAYAKSEHPEWRMGQTYFNVLREVRPDLADGTGDADGITGTTFDPFYDDDRIARFLTHVVEYW